MSSAKRYPPDSTSKAEPSAADSAWNSILEEVESGPAPKVASPPMPELIIGLDSLKTPIPAPLPEPPSFGSDWTPSSPERQGESQPEPMPPKIRPAAAPQTPSPRGMASKAEPLSVLDSSDAIALPKLPRVAIEPRGPRGASQPEAPASPPELLRASEPLTNEEGSSHRGRTGWVVAGVLGMCLVGTLMFRGSSEPAASSPGRVTDAAAAEGEGSSADPVGTADSDGSQRGAAGEVRAAAPGIAGESGESEGSEHATAGSKSQGDTVPSDESPEGGVDEATHAEAERLAELSLTALLRGRYREAMSLAQSSYDLHPTIVVLKRMGIIACRQGDGSAARGFAERLPKATGDKVIAECESRGVDLGTDSAGAGPAPAKPSDPAPVTESDPDEGEAQGAVVDAGAEEAAAGSLPDLVPERGSDPVGGTQTESEPPSGDEPEPQADAESRPSDESDAAPVDSIED